MKSPMKVITKMKTDTVEQPRAGYLKTLGVERKHLMNKYNKYSNLEEDEIDQLEDSAAIKDGLMRIDEIDMEVAKYGPPAETTSKKPAAKSAAVLKKPWASLVQVCPLVCRW